VPQSAEETRVARTHVKYLPLWTIAISCSALWLNKQDNETGAQFKEDIWQPWEATSDTKPEGD
jgi:hypothetical protein